jgi:cellulose synthase operon protein C
LGSRRTPLFIDETEYTHTQLSLTLPPQYVPPAVVPEIKSNSRFGTLLRREQLAGGILNVDEVYRLNMGRVTPAQYEDFSQFAGEVDLIQSRDFSLDRKKR